MNGLKNAKVIPLRSFIPFGAWAIGAACNLPSNTHNHAILADTHSAPLPKATAYKCY